MRTTDERMAELARRAYREKRRREKRGVTALAAACSALCVCLVSLTVIFGGGPHRAEVPGLYGSTLLFENAGGYVLVGVAAFTLAVAVTLLCIRHREEEKKNQNEDEKGGKQQ